MSDAASSMASPQTIAVYDLIDRVSSGELKIPKFQRPYVWSTEDMIELFDSILNGYPIGSLLIWETSRQDISSLEHLGPLKLKNDPRPHSSYVVDGHQRLATLVGVLDLPPDYPSDNMSDWRWWIGYDLETEEFVHFRKKSATEKASIVPLRRIIRTQEFAKLTRDLAQTLPEDKLDLYLDRADYLNRKLRDYKIPATVMRSASLDDAVNIFSRVNQRGRDMTPDQMVSALSFRDEGEGAFDLASRIDDILRDLSSYGFGGTERKSVLQSILFAAGLNFTRPAYERMVDRSSFTTLAPAAFAAGRSLVSSAKFLNNHVGLRTDRLLPYASQLVMLSIYIQSLGEDSGQMIDRDKSSLVRWFWLTSFNGWFAGANTTDLRKASEHMAGLAKGTTNGIAFEEFFNDRPLRELPKAFDRRNARIRASLIVQILSRTLLDPKDGSDLNGFKIFDDESSRDIPYFFPNAPGPLISSPANRVILPGGYGRNALQYFVSIPDEISAEVLESHLVGPDGMSALEASDVSSFVKHRTDMIQKAEADFLARNGLPSVQSFADSGNVEQDPVSDSEA